MLNGKYATDYIALHYLIRILFTTVYVYCSNLQQYNIVLMISHRSGFYKLKTFLFTQRPTTQKKEKEKEIM